MPNLQEQQRAELRQMLRSILPGNSFYRKKFASIAWDACALEELPFTTKNELVEDQNLHPPYGTNLSFDLRRYTRCHQTSGTSGKLLRWLDTPESWSRMIGNWRRILEKAGVTPSDRMLFAFSFGPFLGFWLAFEAAEAMGCLCLAGGGLSSVARLRMLLENRATVLCCTPTYAFRLAEVAGEEKIPLTEIPLKKIIVAGEPGGSIPATRRKLEQAWNGARVFDHHGMTEVGPVTYECPANPGVLHVMEESFIAEVLDPATGRTADAGLGGELVLTTLTRDASPLIRYRTGDFVQPRRGACSCGSTELALEGGIRGRLDDMLIVRGVNIFPSAVEELIRSVGGIAEFQVHVHRSDSLARMEIRFEAEPGSDASRLARELEKRFETAFSMRIPARPVPPQSLPRFELKAKRWIAEDAGGS